MEKFTKEEDRTILDYYMMHGFHLTNSCVRDLSILLNRTEKSIRNRMSRYLIRQYSGFLNKDFHIRVTLIEKLNHALKNRKSTDEVLQEVAEEFMLPYNIFHKKFQHDENELWGKSTVYSRIVNAPNTRSQLMEILKLEDAEYHLFDDIIKTEMELQKKQSFFKKLWLKVKGIFK